MIWSNYVEYCFFCSCNYEIIMYVVLYACIFTFAMY